MHYVGLGLGGGGGVGEGGKTVAQSFFPTHQTSEFFYRTFYADAVVQRFKEKHTPRCKSNMNRKLQLPPPHLPPSALTGPSPHNPFPGKAQWNPDAGARKERLGLPGQLAPKRFGQGSPITAPNQF